METITNEILSCTLNCKYKAYLKSKRYSGTKKDYELLNEELYIKYYQQYYQKLRKAEKQFFAPSPSLSKEDFKLNFDFIIGGNIVTDSSSILLDY